MEENLLVLDVESQERQYETRCWACKSHLVLPHFATAFKCGWCGALTFSKSRVSKTRRWIRCTFLRDKLLVFTVLMIIACITGGGLMAVYPVLFPNYGFTAFANLFITAILAMNTLYNYCLSAFLSAGKPSKVPWGSVDISKGSLEGYTLCDYCQQPKPPQAHHCRTCGICVMDMDHHCPFIGNCVGANNHRHFLLFLVYTLVSILYVLVMSTLAALKIWPLILDMYDPARLKRTVFRIFCTIFTVSFVDAFSEDLASRSLALIYLIILGLSMGIGIFVLLRQQVQLLYEGHTYVDSLQQEQRISVQGWQNFRRIFGSRHPLVWLLPSLPWKSRDKVQ